MSSAVGKTRSIGPLAPQPRAATPDAVTRRACDASFVVDLGPGERNVAAAFGAQTGIVAWSMTRTRLAIREIDRSGKPTGEAHVLEVPGTVSAFGVRALDGHYLVFLDETDFSGPSPITKLFAVVTDANGKPNPSILRVAIGDRGMIDDISPAAAHGVLLWAGPTPATKIDTGRLVTISVDDAGAMTQSFVDIPDPAPGDRAHGFFSFAADHAVVMLGLRGLISDGAWRPLTKTFDPDGLVVAPAFTGNSIPIIGLALGKDAKTMRYGKVTLDGAATFDAKDTLKTAKLRPPFETTVRWGTTTGDGSTQVWGRLDPGGGLFGDTIAVPAKLSAGIRTEVVWSGDQILVLGGDGTTVSVGALPCEHRRIR